jgi:hypothetical protein
MAEQGEQSGFRRSACVPAQAGRRLWRRWHTIMSKPHIHYEAAFEDYLRQRRVPFVMVDEARRVMFAGERIKSFDFLVYPGGGQQWIIDIKGRRFPYPSRRGAGRYWENWVLQADLDSLAEWQDVFGPEFEARFVFTYLLEGPPDRWPVAVPYSFRGESYAFLFVRLSDYVRHCRRRSPRWQTVCVPRAAFREIAWPIELAQVAADEPARA